MVLGLEEITRRQGVQEAKDALGRSSSNANKRKNGPRPSSKHPERQCIYEEDSKVVVDLEEEEPSH